MRQFFQLIKIPKLRSKNNWREEFWFMEVQFTCHWRPASVMRMGCLVAAFEKIGSPCLAFEFAEWAYVFFKKFDRDGIF